LFAIPLVLLVVAEGVERIRTVLARLNRPTSILASVACVAFLLYQPLGRAWKIVQSPPLRDHIKPAMAYISARHLSSDLIYSYYYATPQFEYYAPFYGLDRSPHVEGVAARENPRRYLQDMDSLAGRPRVWFLFSHNFRAGRVDEQSYFLRHLDDIGVRKAEFYSPGVSVYLYDLSQAAQQ